MSGATHGSLAPSAWVQQWAPCVPEGTVLDLACGSGRHARHFAALGHRVLAVDRDAAALASMAGEPRIHTVDLDLEDGGPWPFSGERFAGIVVTNYLHRRLLPALATALAPGGALLYETFMLGNERYGKPSNPEFLLRAGELWDVFGVALQVRSFEQGYRAEPKPAIIQRLCAVRA